MLTRCLLRIIPWLAGWATTHAVASPATWHVTAQTYSLHESTHEIDLHNTTPGLGVIRRQGQWLAGAGVFRNSVGRWAGYAYGGQQWRVGGVLAGAIAGVTHHYNFNQGGIVPLGAAVITLPLAPSWAVDLVAIPRIPNYTYATLHFAVSYRIK